MKPHSWMYYTGLAGLVLFGVVDWPVAAVIVIGHYLAGGDHPENVKELGEALQTAG